MLIYPCLIIAFLDDYDHSKYFMNIVTVIIFILMNIHLFVNKNNVINKFLQRLEENWKSIVDNFQEGLIIFNKDFKIVYKNNSMKTIFGWTKFR